MLIVKPFRVWHLKRWSLSRPQGQKKPQLQELKRKLIAHVHVLNGCKLCWKKEAWLWKMLQISRNGGGTRGRKTRKMKQREGQVKQWGRGKEQWSVRPSLKSNMEVGWRGHQGAIKWRTEVSRTLLSLISTAICSDVNAAMCLSRSADRAVWWSHSPYRKSFSHLRLTVHTQ